MTAVKTGAAIAAVSVGASILVAVTAAGGYAYARATRPQADNSAYANVSPAQYPGSDFVKAMTETDMNGAKTRKTQRSEVPLIPDQCSADDTPAKSMLYSRSAKGDGYAITAQAYGSGQAKSVYDGLASQVASCEHGYERSSKDSVSYISWNGGYLMTAGDAIVSIAVDEASRQQQVASEVIARMNEQMKSTGCAAMDESADDARRSFYYDRNSYKGLTGVEEVSATKKRVDMAVPQNLEDAGGHVENIFVKPVTRSVPESPLPSGMQSGLPSAPALPDIHDQAQKPSETNTITYQMKDSKGPGCGWAWSGQKTPDFNESMLKADYRKTKKDAISAIDRDILDYNTQARSWSLSTLWSMRFASTWDQYVKSANDIMASWNALDAGREAFRPTWMAYIQSLKDWEYRRLAANDAVSDRNNAVSACADAKQSDWQNQNQGKTPDDGQKAQWKQDCDSSTPKADTSAKDAPEPSAPKAPQGITIPGSWPTRDSAIAGVDASYKANKAAEQAQAQAQNNANQQNQTAPQPAQPSPSPSSPAPAPSPSPSAPSPSPSPNPSDKPSSGSDGGNGGNSNSNSGAGGGK